MTKNSKNTKIVEIKVKKRYICGVVERSNLIEGIEWH